MDSKRLIEEITKKKKAVLHYNIATFEQFKAGLEAVKITKIPLIIGFSEGERTYLGIDYIEDLIGEAKEKGINVFLNADHCKNLKSAKEAIDYKFDFVLFDGSELELNENILRTKEIVEYRNKKNKSTLIEGEIGYIAGHSDMKEIAELKEKYFTPIELAREFVDKTKVDLLAISVGNIHGIPEKIKIGKKIFKKPRLDFKRIKRIKEVVKTPLVLHGGSGLTKKDYLKAIESGISIIHINTEFRKIWKKELEKNLKKDTVVPYKILSPVVQKLTKKIIFYQKLFWNPL